MGENMVEGGQEVDAVLFLVLMWQIHITFASSVLLVFEFPHTLLQNEVLQPKLLDRPSLLLRKLKNFSGYF